MTDRGEVLRFRADELRRLAVSLGTAVGIPSRDAARLASHLLWFESAGASAHGIASLPTWLARIEAREVDPATQGVIGLEHPATAVFDARHGIAPLLLARAAEIAGEKAREVGVGLVRITHLDATVPAAEAAGEVAVGPMAAAVLGPGPSWTLAVPTSEGLPAVFDTDLGPPPVDAAPAWVGQLAPWLPALAPPPGNWMVLVLAITATEPLTTFLERAGSQMPASEAPGCLLPRPWSARRQRVREQGVTVSRETWGELGRWAERLRVSRPEALPAPL
jgi:LDH2 family malate/lactate/ureidoglycolate dehydrogenase